MFGLIGKMNATSGQRDALIDILLESVRAMPGCHSYVVAKDPKDADAVWITEVWDSEQSHRASLSLPAVQQAISRGKPLIASFGDYVTTEPVGGMASHARGHDRPMRRASPRAVAGRSAAAP